MSTSPLTMYPPQYPADPQAWHMQASAAAAGPSHAMPFQEMAWNYQQGHAQAQAQAQFAHAHAQALSPAGGPLLAQMSPGVLSPQSPPHQAMSPGGVASPHPLPHPHPHPHSPFPAQAVSPSVEMAPVVSHMPQVPTNYNQQATQQQDTMDTQQSNPSLSTLLMDYGGDLNMNSAELSGLLFP